MPRAEGAPALRAHARGRRRTTPFTPSSVEAETRYHGVVAVKREAHCAVTDLSYHALESGEREPRLVSTDTGAGSR